jgi:hypothetical protein
MLSQADLGLLLVTYKRVENLREILDSAYKSGIRNFFIVVDGLKTPATERDKQRQVLVMSELENWKAIRNDCSIQIKRNLTNKGCSATILNGVDWISGEIANFCVLEDDCIPSSDFFPYVRDALNIVETNPTVLLVSGSQFVPESITENRWQLSHYALTWGWAATSYSWLKLRTLIQNASTNRSPITLDYELVYWKEGSRRAKQGFVDVWDTILVHVLRENGLYSVLPGSNLVINVGNDSEATHTRDDETWLQRPIGKYIRASVLEFDPMVDNWLKTKFYGIGKRHLISTKLTHLLDFLGVNKRKVLPLHERWV